MGRTLRLAVVCVLTVTLAGCRHKVTPVVPIPPPTTVPLATPPPTATRIPSVPSPKVPLTPVEVPLKKPKKVKKKIVALTPPPVLSTPSPPPAAAAPAVPGPPALGPLTLGEGDSGDRKQAQETIASLEHRLSALPQEMINQQREQVGRIAHFAEEAEKALKSGDADGAQSLATKGKLLLDDLLK